MIRVYKVVVWLAVVALLPMASVVRGQCGWEAFGVSDLYPGLRGAVDTMAVYDGGGGPALYVGGSVLSAVIDGTPRVSGVFRLDSHGWAAGPFSTSTVYALARLDDGSGPALYVACSRNGYKVVRVRGQEVTELGGPFDGSIQCMTVYDDGAGPALYAGGSFSHVNGAAVAHAAKWDGTDWVAVGSGLSSAVYALAVFDDGAGPALYAGGAFTSAGGVPAAGIARWRAQSWSAVGGGVAGPFSREVRTLLVDAVAGRLIAGGAFETAGGAPAHNVAVWDGAAWLPLGAGANGAVQSLQWFTDGDGRRLYAVGSFSQAGGAPAARAAAWDGASWSALQDGLSPAATFPASYGAAALEYDDGSGPRLYIGGAFGLAGGVPTAGLAPWRDGQFFPAPPGRQADIRAIAAVEQGPNRGLYAGGLFVSLGGTPANNIARWDGTAWRPLGDGVRGLVTAIIEGDDGRGPAIFAAGSFDRAGGAPAAHIARWDGASWSALGSGVQFEGSYVVPTNVYALASFDDGLGPAVYAGGAFAGAGGLNTPNLARWRDGQWLAVGSPPNSAVTDLGVVTSGPARGLYAGGAFYQIGGAPITGCARWNGQAWSAIGISVSGLGAFAADESGPLPVLYVSGPFTEAGGVAVNGVGAWNGSAWSALGSGAPYIGAMATGAAPGDHALYALGGFQSAGGVPASGVARWDGQGWSALGSGIQFSPIFDQPPLDAAYFDDGSGPALYVSGGIDGADGIPSPRLARYRYCAPCYPNCDASTAPPVLNVNDFLCFQSKFAAGDPYANCDHSTTPPVLNVNDFLCFQTQFAAGCP
jgi:hypothetical protein